jgi:hypothetical protein
MRIRHLQVTLYPGGVLGDGDVLVQVLVRSVGDEVLRVDQIIPMNSFNDMFSWLMQRAEKEIRLAVKKQEDGDAGQESAHSPGS